MRAALPRQHRLGAEMGRSKSCAQKRRRDESAASQAAPLSPMQRAHALIGFDSLFAFGGRNENLRLRRQGLRGCRFQRTAMPLRRWPSTGSSATSGWRRCSDPRRGRDRNPMRNTLDLLRLIGIVVEAFVRFPFAVCVFRHAAYFSVVDDHPGSVLGSGYPPLHRYPISHPALPARNTSAAD